MRVDLTLVVYKKNIRKCQTVLLKFQTILATKLRNETEY